MTVDSRINSLISWKQLKVDYALLILPHRKHILLLGNIGFGCGLCWSMIVFGLHYCKQSIFHHPFNSFQEWVVLVAIQQSVGYVNVFGAVDFL